MEEGDCIPLFQSAFRYYNKSCAIKLFIAVKNACTNELSVTATNAHMPMLMNSGRGEVHLWLSIWEVLVHSYNRWESVVKPCCSLQRRDRSRKKEETRVHLSHLDVPVDSQWTEGQGPAIPSRCTCRLPKDGWSPSRLCLKGSTNI